MTNSGDSTPGSFPFEFDPENQLTQDLVMIMGVVDDLGGDPQVVSNLIARATSISGIEPETDRWYQRSLSWGRGPNTSPEIAVMSDDEWRADLRERAARFAKENAERSLPQLTQTIEGVEDEATVERIHALLTILGVESGPDGLTVTTRDEPRVQEIIKAAKLMDDGYREFVGANLGYMATIDPEVALEVASTEALLDPRVQQILRELRHEL